MYKNLLGNTEKKMRSRSESFFDAFDQLGVLGYIVVDGDQYVFVAVLVQFNFGIFFVDRTCLCC